MFLKRNYKINPTIAIIGKPNVGKSTLFNRLIGKRKAIVSPVEGVTRDRIFDVMDWAGKKYNLIDTGGYLPKSEDKIEKAVRNQAEIAFSEADFIIFLMDGQAEISSSDRHLAELIKKNDKPFSLIINKIDDTTHEEKLYSFYELGLGDPIHISAIGGRNMGDFLDQICLKIPKKQKKDKDYSDFLNLAIVGMPNVGKSSLMNSLLNEEKSIVTEIAGTTRDAVDSYLTYFNKTIRLIDTAGLRKKSKVDDSVEFYSTVRTQKIIQECDIALVLLDAEKGLGAQDKAVIRNVITWGKGLVIVVNKWDTVKKDHQTMKEYVEDLHYKYKYTRHFPVLFISVLKNQRTYSVLSEAIKVNEQYQKKIKTNELNEFLDYVQYNYPPPAIKGKNLKIKYGTQVHHSPPIFAFFCNYPDLYPEQYKRYLENQIRDKFGFEGVPIKISFRKK